MPTACRVIKLRFAKMGSQFAHGDITFCPTDNSPDKIGDARLVEKLGVATVILGVRHCEDSTAAHRGALNEHELKWRTQAETKIRETYPNATF